MYSQRLSNLTKALKENPNMYNQSLKNAIVEVIRAYTFFPDTDEVLDWSPINWSDFEKSWVNAYVDQIPSIMRQVFVYYNTKYHKILKPFSFLYKSKFYGLSNLTA